MGKGGHTGKNIKAEETSHNKMKQKRMGEGSRNERGQGK